MRSRVLIPTDSKAATAAVVLALEPVHRRANLPTVLLTADHYSLGSDPENDLVLPAGDVAPRHCLLVAEAGKWQLRADAPHTWVNNRPTRRVNLNPGDRLAIGPWEFRLRVAADDELLQYVPEVPPVSVVEDVPVAEKQPAAPSPPEKSAAPPPSTHDQLADISATLQALRRELTTGPVPVPRDTSAPPPFNEFPAPVPPAAPLQPVADNAAERQKLETLLTGWDREAAALQQELLAQTESLTAEIRRQERELETLRSQVHLTGASLAREASPPAEQTASRHGNNFSGGENLPASSAASPSQRKRRLLHERARRQHLFQQARQLDRFRSELASDSVRVAQQRDQLEHQRRQLEQERAALGAQSRQLHEQELGLAESAAWWERARADFVRRQDHLAQVGALLLDSHRGQWEREQEFQTEQTRLSDQRDSLDSLHAQLTQRSQELSAREATCVQRDATLHQQGAALERQQQATAALARDLLEWESLLTRRQQSLETADPRLQDTVEGGVGNFAAAAHLDAELRERGEQLQCASHRLQAAEEARRAAVAALEADRAQLALERREIDEEHGSLNRQRRELETERELFLAEREQLREELARFHGECEQHLLAVEAFETQRAQCETPIALRASSPLTAEAEEQQETQRRELAERQLEWHRQSTELAAARADLEKLQRSLEAETRMLQTDRESLGKESETLARLQRELTESQAALHSDRHLCESERERLRALQETLENQQETLFADRELLLAENEELERRRSDWQTRQATLESSQSVLEEDRRALQAAQERLHADQILLEAERERQRAAVAAAESEHEQRQAEISAWIEEQTEEHTLAQTRDSDQTGPSEAPPPHLAAVSAESAAAPIPDDWSAPALPLSESAPGEAPFARQHILPDEEPAWGQGASGAARFFEGPVPATAPPAPQGESSPEETPADSLRLRSLLSDMFNIPRAEGDTAAPLREATGSPALDSRTRDDFNIGSDGAAEENTEGEVPASWQEAAPVENAEEPGALDIGSLRASLHSLQEDSTGNTPPSRRQLRTSRTSSMIQAEEETASEPESIPLPARESVPPTPAAPAVASDYTLDDADPDSISAYMERLLQRNRRRSQAEEEEPAPQGGTPPLEYAAAVQNSPLGEEQAAGDESEDFALPTPRAQIDAESLRADIDSLRHVANLSARTAVASHTWKKMRTAIYLKGMLAATALCVALFLLLGPFENREQFQISGMAALFISIVAGCDFGRGAWRILSLNAKQRTSARSVAAQKLAAEEYGATEPEAAAFTEEEPTAVATEDAEGLRVFQQEELR